MFRAMTYVSVLAGGLSTLAWGLTDSQVQTLRIHANSVDNSSESGGELQLVELQRSDAIDMSKEDLVAFLPSLLRTKQVSDPTFFSRIATERRGNRFEQSVVLAKPKAIAALQRYYRTRKQMAAENLEEYNRVVDAMRKDGHLTNYMNPKVLRTWADKNRIADQLLRFVLQGLSWEYIISVLQDAHKVIFVESGSVDRDHGPDAYTYKGIYTLFQTADGKSYMLVGTISYT